MIQQTPEPLFDREGDDLILHVAIYLTLALCESKIDVPTLDGRTLRVPLKEVCPKMAEEQLFSRTRQYLEQKANSKESLCTGCHARVCPHRQGRGHAQFQNGLQGQSANHV